MHRGGRNTHGCAGPSRGPGAGPERGAAAGFGHNGAFGGHRRRTSRVSLAAPLRRPVHRGRCPRGRGRRGGRLRHAPCRVQPCCLQRRDGAAPVRLGAGRRAEPGLRAAVPRGRVGGVPPRRPGRGRADRAGRLHRLRHRQGCGPPLRAHQPAAGHRADPRLAVRAAAVAAPAPGQGGVPAPGRRGRPRGARPGDAAPPRRRALPRPPGRRRLSAPAWPASGSDGARRPRGRRLRVGRAGRAAHRRRHRRGAGQSRLRPRAAAPAGLGPGADRSGPARRALAGRGRRSRVSASDP